MSNSEYWSRFSSFYGIFIVFAICLYKTPGLEVFGVAIMAFALYSLIRMAYYGTTQTVDVEVDLLLPANIFMFVCFLVIALLVVYMGGVLGTSFVALLTMSPLFLYINYQNNTTKTSKLRLVLRFLSILLYIFTISMFDYSVLPFLSEINNVVLNYFYDPNSVAFIISSYQYKLSSLILFYMSILAFIWNMPFLSKTRDKIFK